jgi:hypothetical protein
MLTNFVDRTTKVDYSNIKKQQMLFLPATIAADLIKA